jgi:hypothetical protein
MHLMPDPMQVKSCVIKGDDKKQKACIEADNRACSHVGAKDNEKEECVNTETSKVEWSDVTAFFQFGFRLRTGIVKKTHHAVHTSDWLGPYNMILAPTRKDNLTTHLGHDHKEVYVSRYVNTPWTEAELQRPFASSGIFNFDADILEDVVGLKAINETIYTQKDWHRPPGTAHKNAVSVERKTEALRGSGGPPSDDPYAKYSRTCNHGDLKPILPRLVVTKNTHTTEGDKPDGTDFSMRLDYSMLSLPKKGIDSLYNLWPTMKSHLGTHFPLRGPYCYGKDPNCAYAIHLSYDSEATPDASIWKGVKGCVAPWPCWTGDPKPPALPPSSLIPEDNHSEGSYVLDPKAIEAIIVYAVGFLLVISLVFNCQLANKIKSTRRSTDYDQGQTPNRPISGSREAQDTVNRTPTSGVSYSQYLREAVEGRSNNSGMEEPLLTSSSDDADRSSSTELAEGVEESKQEAE